MEIFETLINMHPNDYRAVVEHFKDKAKVIEIASRYRDQHKLAHEIAVEELAGKDLWRLGSERVKTLEDNIQEHSQRYRQLMNFLKIYERLSEHTLWNMQVLLPNF